MQLPEKALKWIKKSVYSLKGTWFNFKEFINVENFSEKLFSNCETVNVKCHEEQIEIE